MCHKNNDLSVLTLVSWAQALDFRNLTYVFFNRSLFSTLKMKATEWCEMGEKLNAILFFWRRLQYLCAGTILFGKYFFLRRVNKK